MAFWKLLKQKKETILNHWFEAVAATYPPETASFITFRNDPFANPVGASSKQALSQVLELILEKKNIAEIGPQLDPLIRIRAVQEFSPANAVSFVFALKKIVRPLFEKEKNISEKEWQVFDDIVDGLVLVAFDIYMGCREQIFSYRANHVKSRTMKLLEKADILCEVPDVGTEIIPHDVYKNGGFDKS